MFQMRSNYSSWSPTVQEAPQIVNWLRYLSFFSWGFLHHSASSATSWGIFTVQPALHIQVTSKDGFTIRQQLISKPLQLPRLVFCGAKEGWLFISICDIFMNVNEAHQRTQTQSRWNDSGPSEGLENFPGLFRPQQRPKGVSDLS